jgi:hypothetical protein
LYSGATSARGAAGRERRDRIGDNLEASDFFANKRDLGVDGLARLLKFASNFRGTFIGEEEAADGGLFFSETDRGMVEGGTSEVFKFAILTASVIS